MSIFDKFNYDNTESFRFQQANPEMRVVDVHDGDTFKAIIEAFPGQFYKASVRLNGIDTPEITSKDEKVKASAIRARDRLVELITSTKPIENMKISKHMQSQTFLIHAKILGLDKYGRVLAECRKSKDSSDETFAETLIKERMGVKYGGGSKMDAWAT